MNESSSDVAHPTVRRNSQSDLLGRASILGHTEENASCLSPGSIVTLNIEDVKHLVKLFEGTSAVSTPVDVYYTYPSRYYGTGDLSEELLDRSCYVLEAFNLSRSNSEKIGHARFHMDIESGTLVSVEHACIGVGQQFSDDITIRHLLEMAHHDLDEHHLESVEALHVTSLASAANALTQFIEGHQGLERQRATIILGDVLWSWTQNCPDTFKHYPVPEFVVNFSHARDYEDFIDPFMRTANMFELQDFESCAADLALKVERPENLRWTPLESEVKTCSGMRIGISSANASDNWTNAKLRGGCVVNVCVDLNGENPVRSTASLLCSGEPRLVLESQDRLSGGGTLSTTRVTYTMEDTDEKLNELVQFSNNLDVLRMLKYALVFVGIVKEDATGRQVLECIFKFISSRESAVGLFMSVYNNGPSRSGFASSSAVSGNILKALYKASGQDDIADSGITLGSMILLFENRLGLKSGRQDVDGLLPNGVKHLSYFPCDEFLEPYVEYLDSVDMKVLPSRLLLVDSGIQRSSKLGRKRGLNVRHWALLSRDPERFAALRKSYGIHHKLVDALKTSDWKRLGELFLEYMSMREIIDPGATESIHDDNFGGEKVLRQLFDPMVESGLIYGGMFTGGMGGGVAMLVLADEGIQLENGIRRIDAALEDLKNLVLDNGYKPYANMRVFDYSVNENGLTYL